MGKKRAASHSPLKPNKCPKSPSKPSLSSPVRRSPRLLEKFKFPYKNTSDTAISLSDEEGPSCEPPNPNSRPNPDSTPNSNTNLDNISSPEYSFDWDDEDAYVPKKPSQPTSTEITCYDQSFFAIELGGTSRNDEAEFTPLQVVTPNSSTRFDALEFFEEGKSSSESSLDDGDEEEVQNEEADNEDQSEIFHEDETVGKDQQAAEPTVNEDETGGTEDRGFEHWGWDRYEAEEAADVENNVVEDEQHRAEKRKAAQRDGVKRKAAEKKATNKEAQKRKSANLEDAEDDDRAAQKFAKETEKLDDFEMNNEEPKPEDEMKLGMVWGTMDKFRTFMRDHAIIKKFEYKQKRNMGEKIEYICKDSPKCTWRVYVRKHPHNSTARLRGLQGKHSCKSRQSGENGMADAKWVAKNIEDCIRNHKFFRPKNIMNEIWERKGVRISYWTAYNAKILCHENIYGKYDESYSLVPELCRQILENNPDSIAEWHRNPVDNKFVGLCIAYKASLDGFVNGCRPLVGIDAAFLKGKYGGAVLSAIGLDGNNGLFPIGMYVCRGETYENWFRFLKMLKPHLLKHKDNLTFMSDRCKGLLGAVSDVFPGSHHRFCFRHLYKNFKSKFSGIEMRNLMWKAANSYRLEEYEGWLKEIYKENAGAHAWVMEVEKEAWVRAYFDSVCKSEHVCNNFSESFNNMILDLRDMPIVKLVQKFQLMVMNVMYERREKARVELCMHQVVPRVDEGYEKIKNNIRHYTTTGTTDWLHVASDKYGDSWTVDLKEHKCTCNKWQITGVPCIHALSVILPMRHQWESYVDKYMSLEAYKAAYEPHIFPIEDSKYWKEPEHEVLPPPSSRGPGRQRKNRMLGADELNEVVQRVEKRCSNCQQLGHNKKTCKNDSVPRPAKGRKTTPAEGVNGPVQGARGGRGGRTGRGGRGSSRGGRTPIVVPPATTVARGGKTLGLRGGGGRGRAKRIFYPPSNRSSQASTSSAVRINRQDTYNLVREVNNSETNLKY